MENKLTPVNVVTESVGQFTGMKDKNGKECYEGDIMLCKRDGNEFADKVIFENGCFKLSESFFGYEGEGIVRINDSIIIGNIYSNPELLTATKTK